jgi:ATP-dependent Clp protease ATP-binding subunit ClpA
MGFRSREIGVEQVRGEIVREVERRFTPEFRNRIDEVVIFSPLTTDEVRTIARQYIGQVEATLGRSGKSLRVDPDALELIVSEGYSLACGARFLKRLIDDRIKLPISTRWRDGSHFHASVCDGRVVVESTAVPRLIESHELAYGA